jgi:predicted nucleotidyltransferase
MRKRTHRPLAAALFGKGMQAILAQVFGLPDRRFFLSEIARAARTTPSTLQRNLAALTGAGIVIRTTEGRQVYYQANARCPIFDELKGIVVKTFGMADVLREMLAPLRERIDAAFIYGSIASGEHTGKSDIDLLIVGNLEVAEFSQALLEAEAKLARPISPSTYTREEFAAKLAAGDYFLGKILERPVLYLIGERDEFERRIQTESAKARGARPS